MTKMHRYAAIAALAIFLSGCMAQRQPAPVEEVKPAPEQPAQPPQPPVVPAGPARPQRRG
ncbi:penicillin-binding protein activator LpoB, partial [Salmonella enterica subsp. enterica serovar Wilhelmsburg]